MAEQFIKEGTPEWENICEQCGICCLIKVSDANGNVFLTNVRCAALDKDTRKCRCYAPDMDARDNGCDNCIALGGGPVTRYTLNHEYVVPSFCPCAQKFCKSASIKDAPKTRPDIDWNKTVSETEIPGFEIYRHTILHSDKYFQYLPRVNILQQAQNKLNHR